MRRMEFTILPVTPYQQNCSLVWDAAGRAALIDPGGETERLLAEVAQRGLQLEKILLTHGHLDHVGNLCGVIHIANGRNQSIADARH